MRSGFLKALVLVSLAVILLGMPLLLTPHRIRPSSFARIQTGMTEAPIVELFGAQAGCYDGYGPAGFFYVMEERTGGAERSRVPSGYSQVWCSRQGSILVIFGDDRCVCETVTAPSEPVTWWARVLDRFLPPPSETETDPHWRAFATQR